MLSVLERIRNRFAAREVNRVATFEDIVRRLNAGEELDDDEVAEALERVGRTPDDLQKAVEHLKRRDELLALAATWPTLHADQERLQETKNTLTEQHQAAAKSYQERMKAADDAMQIITGKMNRAYEARMKLRRPEFADAALVAQRTELERQQSAISYQIQDFRRIYASEDSFLQVERNERQKLKSQLSELRSTRLTSEEFAARSMALQQQIDALPEKTAERRKWLADAQREYDRLGEEVKRIEAQMIES